MRPCRGAWLVVLSLVVGAAPPFGPQARAADLLPPFDRPRASPFTVGTPDGAGTFAVAASGSASASFQP